MDLNTLSQDFKKIFDGQVLKDRTSEDTSYLQARFRASGISGHPRSCVLDLLNLPEDAYSFSGSLEAKGIKLMDRGTQIHEYTQSKLINMGLIKDNNLEDGLRIQDDDLLFSGHPDGLLTLTDEHVLLEIKTINSYAFKYLKEPKQEHYYQAQAYIHFVKKIYGFDVKRCLFVYIDRADDDMNMKTFVVDKSDDTIAMILNKLKRMKEFLDNGQIPPMMPGEKDMGMYSRYNTPLFLDQNKNSIEDFPGYRIIANVKTRNVWDQN